LNILNISCIFDDIKKLCKRRSLFDKYYEQLQVS